MHACEQKHRLLYDPFTPASSHKKSQDRHRPVESGPVGTGRVGQLGPGRSGSSEQCLSNSGSFFVRFRPLGRVTTSQNESHMRRQASVFARPASSRIRNSLYFSKRGCTNLYSFATEIPTLKPTRGNPRQSVIDWRGFLLSVSGLPFCWKNATNS